MRAATPPNVHAAIDEQFAARFINARERRIAEQQSAERLEERQIRDSHPVRTGDLSRITPLRCKSQSVPRLFQPALKFKQLEDTRKASRTAWYLLRINAIWRLPEEIEDSFARQGDHARTDQHSVQIARRPPVNFGCSGVPFGINAPSLPRAADEVLQVRKDRPVRFAKEEIVEEDRRRNE